MCNATLLKETMRLLSEAKASLNRIHDQVAWYQGIEDTLDSNDLIAEYRKVLAIRDALESASGF